MITDRELLKEKFVLYEEPVIGRVASLHSPYMHFYYLRDFGVVRLESESGTSYEVKDIYTRDELVMLLIFDNDQKIKTLLKV